MGIVIQQASQQRRCGRLEQAEVFHPAWVNE